MTNLTALDQAVYNECGPLVCRLIWEDAQHYGLSVLEKRWPVPIGGDMKHDFDKQGFSWARLTLSLASIIGMGLWFLAAYFAEQACGAVGFAAVMVVPLLIIFVFLDAMGVIPPKPVIPTPPPPPDFGKTESPHKPLT